MASGFFVDDGAGGLVSLADISGAHDMFFEDDGAGGIRTRTTALDPVFPAEVATLDSVTAYGWAGEYAGRFDASNIDTEAKWQACVAVGVTGGIDGAWTGEHEGAGGSGGGDTPFVPTGVRIVDICEAVVLYLNASVLATPVAARGYLTRLDLEDCEQTMVLVKPAPGGFSQKSVGLGTVQTDYSVNVALILRVTSDAEIDLAIGVLQDIEEAFRGHELSGVGFRGIPAQVPIIYDEDFLKEAKVFRGLVRLTFRGVE